MREGPSTADDPAAVTLEVGAPEALAEPTGPVQGRRIGRYVLLEQLGAGGLGVVYAAFDPQLDRKVAIKVLHRRWSKRPVAAARFEREGKAMAKVRHPNVVQVFDVGTGDDGGFIAMEFVDGVTLRTWQRDPSRTWREIVAMYCGAAKGLRAAHEAGLVHRDFKPDNVLVDDHGMARVLDFGLARSWSTTGSEIEAGDSVATDDVRLTRVGTVEGTLPYMPPERLATAAGDHRSDQFSFFVALYEALFGRRPFDATQPEELTAQIAAGPPVPPADRAVPSRLERAIRRGLAPRPEDRFASLDEVVRELERDPVAVGWTWTKRLGIAAVAGLGAYGVHVATRPGEVVVRVNAGDDALVPDAVTVDGRALTIDADGVARGEVTSGLHELRVVAVGYETAAEILDIDVGGTHELTLTLRREEGTVDLEVEPRGGQVRIDGVDYGSRLRRTRIPTGTHDVIVSHPGHFDRRLRWEVTVGEHQADFVSLLPTLVWRRPASGVNGQPQVLEDLTGDGRPEVLHWNYNRISVFDPWRDTTVVEYDIPTPSVTRLATFRDRRPAVVVSWPDGTVLHLERLDVVAGRGEMTSRWRKTFDEPDQIAGPHMHIDEAGDATVFLAVDGTVLAVDADTGRTRWTAEVPDAAISWLTMADGESPTLFSLGFPTVVALDPADGRIRWVARVGQDVDAGPAPGPASGRRRGTCSTAHLDGDGVPDVLCSDLAEEGSESLVAMSGVDGSALWRREGRYGSVGWVGRTDAPLTKTALVARGDQRRGRGRGIDVLEPATGEVRWHHAADNGELNGIWWHERAYGVLRRPGVVELLDLRTGRSLRRAELETSAIPAPSLTRWPGGDEERLLLRWRRGLAVFDSDLRLVASMSTEPQAPGVALDEGDLDGDGFSDLVIEADGPGIAVGKKIRWRRLAADAIRAAPQVADVDDDGRAELVVTASFEHEGMVVTFDPATGARGPLTLDVSHQVTDAATIGSGPRGISLFIKNDDERLARFEGGQEVAAADRYVETYASPLVTDLDGDGAPEVVVNPWRKGLVHVYDAATLREEWSFELPDGAWPMPVPVDLPDGHVGLVFAMQPGDVMLYDATSRRVRWTVRHGGKHRRVPVLADLDGQGAKELVFVSAGEETSVVAVDLLDGSTRWEVPGIGSGSTSPGVVDLDGDGRDELVVGTARGFARIDADGTVVWRSDRAPDAGRAYSDVIIADLEHDGAPEAIAGFTDGFVWVVDAVTGDAVWQFDTGGRVEAKPVALDVDGDGIDEVIVGSWSRYLYCLEHLPRPTAPATP